MRTATRSQTRAFLETPDRQAFTAALSPAPQREDGREWVKLIAIGSPRAVDDTIRVLYLRGFAELYEWSPQQPTQNPGEVMSLMRRLVRISR